MLNNNRETNQRVNRISQIVNDTRGLSQLRRGSFNNGRGLPECGADERTGWSGNGLCQQPRIPVEEFDHDEFVKEEFGGSQVKPRGISWLWWTIAAILAGLLMFLFLR